ncbi:MAG TPA: NAD(P)-dependent oxidoreductase [Acidimicrobiales bacterium]|jgi:UDP-glucose 4-epimerase|nr:NAD(P)-dependent oxidoreductase [Acidimicrobiales bacterium]
MADRPVVAVTGASGYVGGRLVEALRAAGCPVRPLVRHTHAWLGADQVEVDLLAAGASSRLEGTFDGVDAVVHLAGPNETAGSEEILTATIVGTDRVARAAQAAGVQRLVYLSTMHVYGAAIRDGAVLTEATVPEPRHPYGVARLASEHLAASGPDPVILRLTNSVGAPAEPSVDRWSLVANDLARQAVTTGTVRLATSGRQRRDFCALADVCSWLTAAATSRDRVAAGTYNVGSGHTIEVLELAGLVADAVAHETGRRPEVVVGPDGPQAVDYRVDVGRAAGVGLGPTTPLGDAVAETVAACRDWFARKVHQ